VSKTTSLLAHASDPEKQLTEKGIRARFGSELERDMKIAPESISILHSAEEMVDLILVRMANGKDSNNSSDAKYTT
jgi:hypothetical protein